MASAQNFWSRGAGFVEILRHLLQRWEKTTGYPMVLRSHTILANPAPDMPIGMNWLYFERKTMKIYNIILFLEKIINWLRRWLRPQKRLRIRKKLNPVQPWVRLVTLCDDDNSLLAAVLLGHGRHPPGNLLQVLALQSIRLHWKRNIVLKTSFSRETLGKKFNK